MSTVLTALLALAGLTQPVAGPASPHIVFVCEHGAAKSLVASAYVNKLAAERGLAARATFRGVGPQDALSVRAVAGLKEDGLPIPDARPTGINAADVTAATHMFAIGCSLPSRATQSGKASSWDDVPDDQGYGPMRDAIVRHVRGRRPLQARGPAFCAPIWCDAAEMGTWRTPRLAHRVVRPAGHANDRRRALGRHLST